MTFKVMWKREIELVKDILDDEVVDYSGNIPTYETSVKIVKAPFGKDDVVPNKRRT